MKKQYILLSLILIFLSIGAFQPFGCNTDITGRVTNKNTEEPIEGATVKATKGTLSNPEPSSATYSDTTNINGEYTLLDIPYGTYRIFFTHDGYTYRGLQIIDTSYIDNGIGCKEVNVDIELFKVLSATATYTYGGFGDNPEGLAWDGTNLWSCVGGIIYKYNMDATLSVANTYGSPGDNPEGLAWDGINLWSCDSVTHKIYKHNMDATLSVANTYGSPDNNPEGLAWDGTNLWSLYHVNLQIGFQTTIYKHNMDATLSVAATYGLPFSLLLGGGLAWDGTNLWSSGGFGEIYKYNMP